MLCYDHDILYYLVPAFLNSVVFFFWTKLWHTPNKRLTTALSQLIPDLYHLFMIYPCNLWRKRDGRILVDYGKVVDGGEGKVGKRWCRRGRKEEWARWGKDRRRGGGKKEFGQGNDVEERGERLGTKCKYHTGEGRRISRYMREGRGKGREIVWTFI